MLTFSKINLSFKTELYAIECKNTKILYWFLSQTRVILTRLQFLNYTNSGLPCPSPLAPRLPCPNSLA
jgi:hypothetical protein